MSDELSLKQELPTENVVSRRTVLKQGLGALGAVVATKVRPLEELASKEVTNEPDIAPYILDSSYTVDSPYGRKLHIHPELLKFIAYPSRDLSIGLEVNNGRSWKEITRRWGEIRGYAVPGGPEMLAGTSDDILAERDPKNEIPIIAQKLPEEGQIMVKATDPRGFPSGCQIAIVVPIIPPSGLSPNVRQIDMETVVRVFTRKTNLDPFLPHYQHNPLSQ